MKIRGTKDPEAFAAATSDLVDMQSKVALAGKNAQNSHFRNSYADLPAELEANKDIVHTHNFGVLAVYDMVQADETTRLPGLTISLVHRNGVIFEWQIAQTNDPQKIASFATYARRYSTQGITFNASSNDPSDDDGNAAAGAGKDKPTFKPPKPAQDKKPPAKKTGKASAAQIKAIYAIADEHEFAVEDLKSYMLEEFSVKSTKDLTGGGGGQASKFIKALGDGTVQQWIDARDQPEPSDDPGDESDVPF